MPKYLLLKHYTGGPTQLPSHAPMGIPMQLGAEVPPTVRTIGPDATPTCSGSSPADQSTSTSHRPQSPGPGGLQGGGQKRRQRGMCSRQVRCETSSSSS